MTSSNSRPRYPSHLWTHTGVKADTDKGGVSSPGLVSFLAGSCYSAQVGPVLSAPCLRVPSVRTTVVHHQA